MRINFTTHFQTPKRGSKFAHSLDVLSRGKQSLSVDLKQKEGVSIVRRLCRSADVFIEPFRPGNDKHVSY